MRLGRTCVVVASVAALWGCTRSLDMEGVKKAVGDLVKGTGATVKSVACPEQREMKGGDTFDCTVGIDQGSVKVTLTQSDDKGNVNMKMSPSVLKVGELEKLIAGNIQQNSGVDATVDCGAAKFRPATANETFDCTARAGEESLKVKVKVKDDQGSVSFETVPPPDAAAAPDAPTEDN